MRRSWLIVSLAALLLILGVPHASLAGSCKVSGTNECYPWGDQGDGTDPNKSCLEQHAGTYFASIECAAGSTQTPTRLPTQCCFYVQGNCEAPYASGACPSIAGLPTGQVLQGACSTLPQCTGLGAQPRAALTVQEPKKIFFTPQLPIPGSSLFNGQEIVVTGSTLGEYIAALYVMVVGAIAILAAVMIFYGGLKWLTAAGNRGRVQDAKETISSAIIGIVLAFGAYILLLTISPNLVKFRSLELRPVSTIQQKFSNEVAFGARGATMGTVSLSNPIDWLDNAQYGVRRQYGTIIAPLATPQVPIDLIYAIIFVESGGRPEVVSGAGACGIMQLLPSTAKRTCLELQDPAIGIPAGVAYLKELASDTCPQTAVRKDNSVAKCQPPDAQPTGCTKGDLYYVAAAYNGGKGANCGSIDCPGYTWWECAKNTGYLETRNYVAKVEDARAKLNCALQGRAYPCP